MLRTRSSEALGYSEAGAEALKNSWNVVKVLWVLGRVCSNTRFSAKVCAWFHVEQELQCQHTALFYRLFFLRAHGPALISTEIRLDLLVQWLRGLMLVCANKLSNVPKLGRVALQQERAAKKFGCLWLGQEGCFTWNAAGFLQ